MPAAPHDGPAGQPAVVASPRILAFRCGERSMARGRTTRSPGPPANARSRSFASGVVSRSARLIRRFDAWRCPFASPKMHAAMKHDHLARSERPDAIFKCARPRCRARAPELRRMAGGVGTPGLFPPRRSRAGSLRHDASLRHRVEPLRLHLPPDGTPRMPGEVEFAIGGPARGRILRSDCEAGPPGRRPRSLSLPAALA